MLARLVRSAWFAGTRVPLGKGGSRRGGHDQHRPLAQRSAQVRTEPNVSVPSAMWHSPAATAAPAPFSPAAAFDHHDQVVALGRRIEGHTAEIFASQVSTVLDQRADRMDR